MCNHIDKQPSTSEFSMSHWSRREFCCKTKACLFYVMVLRPLYIFYSFSAGIDLRRRQTSHLMYIYTSDLTSVDVRF